MNQMLLNNTLGKVDIYLLDQIMKNRYSDSDLILDAGCGSGRNLTFCANLGLDIEGCDADEICINDLKNKHSNLNLVVADLDNLPYQSNHFDHIICNAVLHFATNKVHFTRMVNELNRILKPTGTLFIRMASEFGLESKIVKKDDQYLLPDGSLRFLLNNELINELKTNFKFIEPLKTVNVNNLRCMSTLVLEKLI